MVEKPFGSRSVNHRHQQHFIFLFRRLNVEERATGNHCRRFCGPKQDIRVVHLVDFIHYQNIVSKFVEHQPICEGIHRFGAPPQTGIERPQFRRREVPAGGSSFTFVPLCLCLNLSEVPPLFSLHSADSWMKDTSYSLTESEIQYSVQSLMFSCSCLSDEILQEWALRLTCIVRSSVHN